MSLLHPTSILCRVGIALITLSVDGAQSAVNRCFAQTGAANSKIASIPIDIAGENYILIKARVNGSEPLTFVLDSGGGSGFIIYFKAAQALRVVGSGNSDRLFPEILTRSAS